MLGKNPTVRRQFESAFAGNYFMTFTKHMKCRIFSEDPLISLIKTKKLG